MPALISLTLYDKDDQPQQTYTREVIPWGLLKKAIRITDAVNDAPAQPPKRAWLFERTKAPISKEEAQIDLIAQFVVELFGNRFTVRDLDNGADLGEIMAVFQAVLTRARTVVEVNPTVPPQPRKRH
jgi:hypothetical protein